MVYLAALYQLSTTIKAILSTQNTMLVWPRDYHLQITNLWGMVICINFVSDVNDARGSIMMHSQISQITVILQCPVTSFYNFIVD